MENLNVHGYSVSFDEGAREGVHHLMNIGYGDAKIIFDKAVADGATAFEFESGGYKLTWNSPGSYTLSKKY